MKYVQIRLINQQNLPGQVLVLLRLQLNNRVEPFHPLKIRPHYQLKVLLQVLVRHQCQLQLQAMFLQSPQVLVQAVNQHPLPQLFRQMFHLLLPRFLSLQLLSPLAQLSQVRHHLTRQLCRRQAIPLSTLLQLQPNLNSRVFHRLQLHPPLRHQGFLQLCRQTRRPLMPPPSRHQPHPHKARHMPVQRILRFSKLPLIFMTP
mmetsp:Transcript_15781/g.23911  ORF Transcript_15781/g.23911 Transcript_15781/m.23911 type:complete len:202 (+) Transcript_15781:111-716(+)